MPANFIESFFVDDYNPDPGNDPTLHNDGQKDGQYVKDWECNPPKSAPPKNNLVHGLATYSSGTPDGQEYIFGSASKDADNGTNYLGFWLFLDPNVGCTPNYDANGNFLGANANGLFGGNHVDGDWLLISDYTNGGGVASFNAYRWNDPDYRECLDLGGTKSSCASLLENGDEVLGHFDMLGGSGECLTGGKGNGPNPNDPISHNNAADECGAVYVSIDCNPQNAGQNNVICATTNTLAAPGSVTAAWNVLNNNPGNGDVLAPPTYFEFAINVKTLVETPPESAGYPGQEFCGGKFMIESRTSAELFGASLKDYILSDFRVCGDLKVVKLTDPVEDPPTTDFDFTVTQDPDGAATDITGDADPTNTLGDGEFFEITDLSVGEYNISEDHPLPTGWVLDTIACVNDAEPPGTEGTSDGANGVDVDLAAEKITCTFTNIKPPKLKLVKNVTNDHGGTLTVTDFAPTTSAPGTFTFGGNTGTATNASYNTGFVTTTAGTYSLSETNVAGYAEGTWDCDNSEGTDGAFDNGSVTLENGDEVTCTITNNDIAPTLKLVKKVTNDDGGTLTVSSFAPTTSAPGTFTFGGNTGTATNAVYSTAAVTTSAGTYSLSETNVAGYAEGSWSCTDGGGGAYNAGSVTLSLDEDVVCEITNDDIAPTLQLVKKVTNDNGGTLTVTSFAPTTSAPGTFTFGANTGTATNAVYSTAVVSTTAGTYSLSETNVAGYAEGTWSCTDGGGGAYNAGSVTLSLDEDVVCEITNNDIAPRLRLKKTVVNDDGGLADPDEWTLVAGSLINTAGVDQGDDTALTAFATATAGVGYALSETGGPSGYQAGSYTCNGGTLLGQTVTLGLAEDVTCSITNNDIAPRLKLVKVVVNGANPGGTAVANDWTLTADANAPFDTRDKSVAGGSDSLTTVFANNAYALAENGPSGYDAGSWDCEDSGGDYAGQSGSSVTLGLADEVTCTITNTARGMVDLTKYFNGVLVTDAVFNFTLTGPDIGGPLNDSTPPNPVDFGGAKLIPGQTYTICEVGLGAGMTAFWSIDTTEPPDGIGDVDLNFVGAKTGALNEVYNPDAPTEDLGNRCVDFQVGIGETVNFVVDNVVPLGDARTPGYWKNWSSCSAGNQFAKAADEYSNDPSGLLDARHWTLDEALTEAFGSGNVLALHVFDTGIWIGDLQLFGDSDGDVYNGSNDADCEEAVKVLNSSDQKATRGGKDNPVNRSNDPAYKLARYLLAFIANQTAGAYQCALATDAAEAAQLLLDDIGFIGEGDYLNKKGGGSEADAANALYYHGILGQYVENDPGLSCGGTLSPPYP